MQHTRTHFPAIPGSNSMWTRMAFRWIGWEGRNNEVECAKGRYCKTRSIVEWGLHDKLSLLRVRFIPTITFLYQYCQSSTWPVSTTPFYFFFPFSLTLPFTQILKLIRFMQAFRKYHFSKPAFDVVHFNIQIMNLKASTISELRSYSSPPAAVHRVMVATFLLLGVKERDTKQWSNVQVWLLSTRWMQSAIP